jgi:hypothetical protein
MIIGEGGGFILKGFPSILHFVSRHRRDVEGRSSGSKDTLPFGPETSGSKERAFSPPRRYSTLREE